MKLLIHDLPPEDWDRINRSYTGWHIICDDRSIHPCVGCFSCWGKTPGQCVIKDGFDDIGALFHRADEVLVISRYTYGGFSSFVKSVFDRCIGYVLPQLEDVRGETHHKRRYDEDKPFSFTFYGHGLNSSELVSARRYVTALCANARGHVRNMDTMESPQALPFLPGPFPIPSGGKVVLLNGSMRAANGNSAKLARRLSRRLHRESEIVNLQKYVGSLSKLVSELGDATDIVVCTPLYLDGLPSQVIRFMETAQREYRGGTKRIYTLANMGLYESRQLVNLFDAVRQWSDCMGFEYCGGLGVGAGEFVGVLMRRLPFSVGFTQNISRGMTRLAQAIDHETATEDIYADLSGIPKWLYLRIANNSWDQMARRNGILPEELYRQL